jgi:hypothetical protein
MDEALNRRRATARGDGKLTLRQTPYRQSRPERAASQKWETARPCCGS